MRERLRRPAPTYPATRKDGSMARLPWRFVMVTDVGVDSGNPVRVERGRVAEWLRSIGAGADIPASGGRPALRLALDSSEAFSPAAVAGRLAGPGAGAAGGVGGTSGAGGGATTSAPAAEVDAVLHDPAFQRVESAYRGLELLLDHA